MAIARADGIFRTPSRSSELSRVICPVPVLRYSQELLMFAKNISQPWNRALMFAFGIIALCSVFSGTASAQLSERKTRITFTVPVEIPDAGAQVLPPGTYVFKLVDSKTDRNIVQILSSDELHVFATVLAIPNFRLKATDKTVMTFAERAAGEPQAIRA